MEKETVKYTMTIEVEIPVENWIDYLMKDNEIFGTACGYWLRGVARDETGWLVWVDDEKCRHGEEPEGLVDGEPSSYQRSGGNQEEQMQGQRVLLQA